MIKQKGKKFSNLPPAFIKILLKRIWILIKRNIKKIQFAFTKNAFLYNFYFDFLLDRKLNKSLITAAPLFNWNITKDFLKDTYSQFFPSSENGAIISSEDISNNIIPVLENKKLHLGKDIEWQKDYRSGQKWSKHTFYTDIKYHEIPALDVKIPWEISRFQHLIPLGKAYFLTDDERYPMKFVSHIENWLQNNPYARGINWSCAMELALRTINWTFALAFFQNSPSVNSDFIKKFIIGIYLHGYHILRNLEGTPQLRSNHYLSDVIGLLFLGTYYPFIKESRRWQNKGHQALIEEMEKQVYPDGVDFEASTTYHCLALELFTLGALTCRQAGLELPQRFWDHLEKMYEFLHQIIKPNGEVPQIGDNDSGRIFNFTDAPPTDRLHLMPIGAVLFSRREWKTHLTPPSEDLLWLMGIEAFNKYSEWDISPVPKLPVAFPDAGWYLIRDDEIYLLISCGLNGQNGNGGHAHNDKLSFELNMNGHDVIVDPGTYIYIPYPEWRNRFRSTRWHNTVCVDGEEQNRFIKRSLFCLEQDAHTRCLRWDTSGSEQIFTGEHDGYARLPSPVIHRRTIRWDKSKRTIFITDFLKTNSEHCYEISFH
ncbi:MAG: alginate lyase family protein, partial [bacterium]